LELLLLTSLSCLCFAVLNHNKNDLFPSYPCMHYYVYVSICCEFLRISIFMVWFENKVWIKCS
jgi:hypothetical protein